MEKSERRKGGGRKKEMREKRVRIRKSGRGGKEGVGGAWREKNWLARK